MNRETVFSELAQKIKVDKLMSYKPKHKTFENPEVEIADSSVSSPPKLFESFAFSSQSKIANGDSKGTHAATDSFLVILQDMILKK